MGENIDDRQSPLSSSDRLYGSSTFDSDSVTISRSLSGAIVDDSSDASFVESHLRWHGGKKRIGAAQGNMRAIEEAHAPYEEVRELISTLSAKYGVTIKPGSKMEAGRWKRSPHFFQDSALLQQHVDDIRFPKSVGYVHYTGDPSKEEPIIAKNETVSKGKQKYLLEDGTQLAIFKEWMETHGNPREWIMQEFIQTPGNAPSSFRVLVDCTGEVLASQIKYGLPHDMNARKNMGGNCDVGSDPSKLLELKGSEFFIDSKDITSNRMLINKDDTTIGGRITLSPLPNSHPYSLTEMSMLSAYGLDGEPPMLPQLPKEVARIASGIGKTLGTDGGKNIKQLVLGIDIIQKEGTNEFFVLEANNRPSLVPIRDLLGSANSVTEISAWQWVINGAMHRLSQGKF